MKLVTDALAALARQVVDGVRVIGAHWPELVGLFLAGWAARMGLLWLAVLVSDVSPTLGVLILPLAPMATLLSLVLMLRAMAPSLPAFSSMVETLPARRRWVDNLTVAGQVLIPFLAVYASAGLLKQDVRVFLFDSTADEWLNTNVQSVDFGRADYAPGATIIAFVVIALVLRKAISMRGLAERHLAWAAAAIYLEVLWLITLANALTAEFDKVTEWVTSRRLVAGVLHWWEGIVEVIRAWGAWATTAVDAVSALLGSLGNIVVVPVAWLAIGAAVYGHKLAAQELRVETHEDVTRRIKRIPNPLRRAALHVAEPVTTPVKDALTAIGKVAGAGILPMVMFCLVFLVANQLQVLVASLARVVVGPGSDLRQYALEPYVLLAERLVYFVVALSLIAAAVNVVVLAQRREAHEGTSSTK